MRIGIIGSGIAGLSAVWHLGQQHHVEVFEARPVLGMDAASVRFDHGGRAWQVDVPLRVFGNGYYPHLVRLYDQAGVRRGAADYNAGFSTLGGPGYFGYRTVGLGAAAVSLPDLAWMRTPGTARRVAAATRFFTREPLRLRRGDVPSAPLAGYLASRRYDPLFVDDVLLPILAAVLTCSYDHVRSYPADAVIDFFARTRLSRFDRVDAGTADVVARLSKPAARVHLSTPVACVERGADGVRVRTVAGDEHVFDHVVFATQVHRAVPLVADLRDDERDVLEAFEHVSFRCVVHRDEALMPARRADWRPINAIVAPGAAMPMFTMHMNAIVPGLRDAPTLLQTIHPLIEPRADRVVREVTLDRPVLGVASRDAYRRVLALHRETDRTVWFCGSYVTDRLPLLESATVSAARVARHIDRRAARSAGTGR